MLPVKIPFSRSLWNECEIYNMPVVCCAKLGCIGQECWPNLPCLGHFCPVQCIAEKRRVVGKNTSLNYISNFQVHTIPLWSRDARPRWWICPDVQWSVSWVFFAEHREGSVEPSHPKNLQKWSSCTFLATLCMGGGAERRTKFLFSKKKFWASFLWWEFWPDIFFGLTPSAMGNGSFGLAPGEFAPLDPSPLPQITWSLRFFFQVR